MLDITGLIIDIALIITIFAIGIMSGIVYRERTMINAVKKNGHYKTKNYIWTRTKRQDVE